MLSLGFGGLGLGFGVERGFARPQDPGLQVAQRWYYLPIGSIVVSFWGSYLESYRVIPKRNYLEPYGYRL